MDYARGSPVGGEQALRITSLQPSPAMRSRCNAARCRGQSTSPRPRRCRREVELGERRAQGIEARRGKTCLLGRFSVRRAGRAASTATASAAADPGVVLCVADGIIRIAAGIIRAAVRLSEGIDRLTGVTAGEEKRCDHDRDAEPHGRFPTHWSRPVGRSFGPCAGEVGHHALRRLGWQSH